jgi:putative ABC transport system permease protein
MRIPLAWLNLWHDKTRTATALAGTTFAVVLVLMQLGFFRSVLHTAGVVYQELDFDIVITSVRYQQMLKPGDFDEIRLTTAQAVAGVRDAMPVSLGMQLYRNPETGLKRSILVIGVDPKRHYVKVLKPEQLPLVMPADRVLMDELSRPEYGERRVELKSEIGSRAVEVVGLFHLGCGFGADGTVVTSTETFAGLFPPRTSEQISLGLVRLTDGADPGAVVERLKRALPQDVAVMTRKDFLNQERYFWVVKTSVGVIFGLGVVVSIMVGAMVVYQVLSADIAKRMPEYATLKAMGYPESYLTKVILTQATIIGAVGFVPGWLLAGALYWVTRVQANLFMEMGIVMPVTVFFVSVIMCAAAGLISLRKVAIAAPADLFT